MKRTPPTYLKVAISLDLTQEADRRLKDFVDSLPQGLKANVIRRLLMQAMPESDAGVQQLLGLTAMDARVRNQQAGRPRREDVADPAAPVGPAVGQSAATAAGRDATPAGEREVMHDPASIEMQEAAREAASGSTGGRASDGPVGGNEGAAVDAPPGDAVASAPAAPSRRLKLGGLVPSFTG
jgi:hypothetical protein